MQVGDCEDDHFAGLDNVDQTVREPPQTKSAHAIVERMPRLRALGDALPRDPDFINEPLLKAWRLRGIPCDGVVQLGGSWS
jgi:hypothetical protein